MGTRAGTRLYLEGSEAEVGAVIDRMCRARGYRLVQRVSRLAAHDAASFFRGSGERGHLVVAWTTAREGCCLVLGLDESEMSQSGPPIVFASDLVAGHGKDALDFGVLDTQWWCRYYVQGVLEEEYGNVLQLPFYPWLTLAFGEPNRPTWARARAFAYDAYSRREPEPSWRQTIDGPGLTQTPRGQLERSHFIHPNGRGQFSLRSVADDQAAFFQMLLPALDLAYADHLFLETLQMQSFRLEHYPEYLKALEEGMGIAHYVHPILAQTPTRTG